MRISAGQVVLLTGASGGLGEVIAREFAQRGLNLVLNAYPGLELPKLQCELEKLGVRVLSVVADLRDPEARRGVVKQAVQAFGKVDILVNNAGVEFTSNFHDLSERQIQDIIDVNLHAAMVMSHLLLPAMISRRSGHIVNISSLAAKSGPACQECYAATKAGLIGFTASLRASYKGTGVSSSVIVPGFVEAGIYVRLKEKAQQAAPALLKSCPPEWVSSALVRAVERDSAEVVVNRYPVWPVLLISAISPQLGAWISDRLGSNEFFRRVTAAGSKENHSEEAVALCTQRTSHDPIPRFDRQS